jgi:hypothetical protein
VSALVSCELLSTPPYTETNFEVLPGPKHAVAVQPGAGDTLVSISGTENYIGFYIEGLSGELIYGVERDESSLSFEMICQACEMLAR